jgi:hypothetical protein
MPRPHQILSTTAQYFELSEQETKKVHYRLLCVLLTKLTRLSFKAIGAYLGVPGKEVYQTLIQLGNCPDMSLMKDLGHIIDRGLFHPLRTSTPGSV